mmetsp:Transcript_45675/g.145821  ORF Transcript_45675/g.145821 Transcript_45675/m.145821 type:complete len:625 (+) Transcript_45675:74-1948(+)
MWRRWAALQCHLTFVFIPLVGWKVSRLYVVNTLFPVQGDAPQAAAPRCSEVRGDALAGPSRGAPAGPGTTFCNPLDLPYSFQPSQPAYREAADPSMVVFKGAYFLFVSKSGGYFHSRDLVSWTLVEPSGLPLADYAPTAMVMGDKMYFTASFSEALYATEDPFQGVWTRVATLDKYWDPFLFLDDDGRVYLAWGCSNVSPIFMVRLDPAAGWRVVEGPVVVAYGNASAHGWERAKFTGVMKMILGEAPFIEGAWINKVNGRYHLQYAGPGTELKAYGDGVFLSDGSIMGPYRRDSHSPVSHKPTGFIAGAGHGSTFQDLEGQWWHIVTGTISVRHNFERRIMLFPAYFDPAKFPPQFRVPDGAPTPSMLVDTLFGDFPMRLNQSRPAWQLLSLAKRATASSSLWGDSHPPSHAVDEDITTWWSAATGGAGEWLAVDLGAAATVHAVQLSFADQDALARGRLDDAYRYHAEWSLDGEAWQLLPELDRRASTRDAAHDYAELATPLRLRHLRVTSSCVPAGARFSVSGLRLFGQGPGPAPRPVAAVRATRDPADPRQAEVSWQAAEGAQYYVLRYGLEGGPLFQHLQVYGATRALVDALSLGLGYSFAVDAVNEAGVAQGQAAASA